VLYAHRSIEAAKPEADFAAAQLTLSPDDHVLDLCCGSGRHMAHLRRHTPHVTGLDFSPVLLSKAQETLEAQAHLVRADMRAIPFVNCYDAVFNFFTSFGYFMDAGDNEKVITGMALSLRAGGRFFMDFINYNHAVANLVPTSERTAQGYHIREERWIDDNAQRMNKRTTVLEANEIVSTFDESVRLYTADELCAMLDQMGLVVHRTFGDYDGSAVANDRPRLILVGDKTSK
jgi:SAM-dependent methyltransferase